MSAISKLSRSTRLALRVAAAVIPVTVGAQTPDTATSPDPLFGVPLGGGRSVVNARLVARGWTRVVDSVPTAIGNPAIFAGTIDGRPVEILAMFSDTRDRLLQLIVNVPVASDTALRSTFVWAYRRVEALRCPVNPRWAYGAQLDSTLAGQEIGIPDRGTVGLGVPVMTGHTSLALENLDWPSPTWLTRDAQLGTHLSVSMLSTESRWPYQVSIRTSALYAHRGSPTMCRDTRAVLAALDPRPVRAAAPGEKIVMDTLFVHVGQGVRASVGAKTVRTGAIGQRSFEDFTVVAPRGKAVAYAFAADTGFESLTVLTDEDSAAARGSIPLEGNREMLAVTRRKLDARDVNKKIYDLFRKQLTASDPLAVYVEIECEMENLMTTRPKDWEQLFEEAEHLAIDRERDQKALARIDSVLVAHTFAGCVADRAAYKKPQ